MIDSVKLNGIGAESIIGGDDAEFLEEQFYEAVEQCQNFVFQQRKEGETATALYGSHPLDAPFKVFSIEIAGKHNFITSPKPTDKEQVHISCLVAVETSPRHYLVYAHAHLTSHPQYVGGKLVPSERVIIFSQASALLQTFIDRLNTEEVGVQKIKERMKIGTGKTKRQIEIRKITYISPKRSMNKIESVYSLTIDWSHRWFVRGHWRDITSDHLGKNRAGDYCLYGQTWVVEHAKGNPDKEILNKVRVVSP